MKTGKIKLIASFAAIAMLTMSGTMAALATENESEPLISEESKVGGGYAVVGDLENIGYTAQIYDATNGLPTSDANYIMGSKKGYVWIGGYSGVFKYDGSNFEKMDSSIGLTSARGIFEDSLGRIWVGTNDNGVVVIDGEESKHFTYRDGLRSSSIRVFAEDDEDNVFIATTSGLAYADAELNLHLLDNEMLNNERVLKLDSDSDGNVYGQTKNGVIFKIKNCKITDVYTSEELGFDKITCILADPSNPGKVYITTETSTIYYGNFADRAEQMQAINVAPISNVHWISYDCGHIWLSSTKALGYLDENYEMHMIEGLPMDSSIEMHTSDYQGNIWVASSTQGVMKIAANNFMDLTKKAGLPEEVVNTTCMFNNRLYIGTDSGLQILDENSNQIQNELTAYIGNSRIRSIMDDSRGNLWIATYTNNLGLVCLNANGSITSFNEENGMPHNEIRCTKEAKDGSIIVGTNGGVAIIKDGKIEKVYGAAEGMKNTVILTVEEENSGKIFAGTDGDGIYIIDDNGINVLGRDDGLTSDVVMRIKKDDKNEVVWFVTSNSIQYLKDGAVYQVKSFPYNNNYDFYFDKLDNIRILSSTEFIP